MRRRPVPYVRPVLDLPAALRTLEETAARARQYRRGILVQSTGELEDDFDVETMQELEELQKERFSRLVERLRAIWPDCLPMASGACSICGTCTYPDAPLPLPPQGHPLHGGLRALCLPGV